MTSQGPTGFLRGESHRLAIERVKYCKQREFYFTNRVAKDRNVLPSEAINACSTNAFKNKIDFFFKRLNGKNLFFSESM